MMIDLNKWIQEIKSNYSGIHFFTIGYSVLGRPIHALSMGSGPNKIMVNASHHANEWLTTLLLMRFAEESAEKIPDEICLYLVPMVNPDGVNMVLTRQVTGDWKANTRGVDLNSNYPAGWEQARKIKNALGYDKPGSRGYVGPYPLSEPESKAMADFTREMRFGITLSLHTQGEEIYWRYGDFLPPRSREIGSALAMVSGYLLEDTPDESSHAGYKDWFIQEFDKPGFTIECGLGENPLPMEDFDGIYPKAAAILWQVINMARC
jgi:g-D-glutamyl-meso-diaminopimelate peptidase